MYYNKRQTCVPFHSEWFHRSFLNHTFHFTLLRDLHILNVLFVFIMVERNSFMKLHSVRRLSFTAVSRSHQLRQSWVFNSSEGNNLNFKVLCLAFENFSREGLSMYSTKTDDLLSSCPTIYPPIPPAAPKPVPISSADTAPAKTPSFFK